MSSCIKDLYDYNLIKKFSNCGNVSIVFFTKIKTEKMVYNHTV